MKMSNIFTHFLPIPFFTHFLPIRPIRVRPGLVLLCYLFYISLLIHVLTILTLILFLNSLVFFLGHLLLFNSSFFSMFLCNKQ